MIFAHDDEGLTLCLYAASKVKLNLGGVPEVIEETYYPLRGNIELTLKPESKARFAVRLEFPRGRTIVSSWRTYRYVNIADEQIRNDEQRVKLFVNNEPVELNVDHGFDYRPSVVARRQIRLELPMPVRANRCRKEVAA